MNVSLKTQGMSFDPRQWNSLAVNADASIHKATATWFVSLFTPEHTVEQVHGILPRDSRQDTLLSLGWKGPLFCLIPNDLTLLSMMRRQFQLPNDHESHILPHSTSQKSTAMLSAKR